VVRNELSATSVGGVVQAGVVHGGLHVYAMPVHPVPRQLPAAPDLFAGRLAELAELDRITDASAMSPDGPSGAGSSPGQGDGASGEGAGTGTTVLISALAGAGGIGKTWLALTWAHRHAQRFPDGQLFVDLHGFSPTGTPTAPAVAVRGFLDALGVEPGQIPADLDAQAALYRSLVAHKRMLIVLDNAATTEQVTPLLPGGGSCTVVVTSRSRLAGLVTRHGAHPLRLDTLTDTESRVLLATRLGAACMAAEVDAVTELVGLCAGFPLALGLIAGRAHSHPQVPLSEFAAELRESGVDALDDADPTASLPAVLSLSQRGLTTEQHTVFALLGIAPGPDIGLSAAASLTGLPPPRVGKALRALEGASLLNQQAHNRYSMHDLIRGYAAATALHDLTDQTRNAALRRVLDFYSHTAHAADYVLDPHRAPIEVDPRAPGTHLFPLPDVAATLAWFDTERLNLLAAQHMATTHRLPRTVWLLAWALTTFLDRRGHIHDEVTVGLAVLDAAVHMPDPVPSIHAHRHLGRAYADLRRHEEAIGHLHQALALAGHHPDPAHLAHTHQMLAGAWEQQGDDRRAVEHATRALDIFHTLDQPVWTAGARDRVGWYTARLGDHDTARTHCRAALNVHRRHSNPAGEADARSSLGYIEHHSGHHNQAIHHYQQALALYRDLGHAYHSADILDDLGHSHASLRQHEQARTVWREVLELYRWQGRDEDAQRVQRQLDALNHRDANGDPPTDAG
jgi:tetratricopeptide (TPR) repeat protein